MISGIDFGYLRQFYQYAKPHRKSLFIGMALLPFSIAMNLAFPWLTIQVIDKHLAIGEISGLPLVIAALVAVTLGSYVFDTLYSYLLRRAGQKTVFDLRMQLLARVLKLPRKYFDKTPTGVTLSRLTSDLEAISDAFVMNVMALVRDAINTVALVMMMLLIDWQLALIVLLVFPPVLGLTQWVRVRLREMYRITRSSLAKGAGYLQECLVGVKTVQLYRAEQAVEAQYKVYNDEFLKAQVKSNGYDAALFSIITGVTSITIGLIIWFGAGQILAGSLTLGVLIAFINNMEKVFVPLRDFTSQIASIQRSFAAFDHIDELFSEPTQNQGKSLLSNEEIGTQLDRFESLEFKNVSFRYQPDAPYVLKDISFTLMRGQQFALVGSTGSGKSTILKLITQVYDDYEGDILLNGLPLNKLPIERCQPLLSMMQQDVYLFEGPLAFNIGLGKDGISEADIRDAAAYVYADQLIERLPGGYNFEIKQGGANLSAGQQQLISFARAVAQGGDLIMLDEATSSVDSLTEQAIQKAIARFFHDKTVIAVAHRLSTIQHSDQILVLHQGEIVERGNHSHLMQQQGVYAQLQSKAAKEVEQEV